MHKLEFALFLTIVGGSAVAQTAPYPVGVRDSDIANVTSVGSTNLRSRVHYPATTAGTNAPILARQGGWPVFVFLHGFGALGSFYPDLGNALAAQGIVAVMSETAWVNNDTQRNDGLALFPSLVAENTKSGGFFAGALDMQRCAVGGHSMGGGNTLRVLAQNPGYKGGIAFAPVAQAASAMSVKTPFVIVHGEGDSIVPWLANAQVNYDALTGYTQFKSLYLMNSECTHTNLVFRGTGSNAVFDRTLRVTLGFLAHLLLETPAGLEDVLGDDARTEPRLTSLSVEVEAPLHWQVGSGKLGTTQALRVAGEPAVAALFYAGKRASTATAFGTLLLDPASLAFLAAGPVDAKRLYVFDLVIPNDASLNGARFPFQGLGLGRGQALRLSNAVDLEVVR